MSEIVHLIKESVVCFQTWETITGVIYAIVSAILLTVIFFPTIYYIVYREIMREKYSTRDYVEVILLVSSAYMLFFPWIAFDWLYVNTGLLDEDYLLDQSNIEIIGAVLAIIGSMLVIKRLKQTS